MQEDTIKFYNDESPHYTLKRYPQIIQSYTQYVFKKRLSFFLSCVPTLVSNVSKPSILEIGCADGIVFKALEDSYPLLFERFIGVDISPGMVQEASNRNTNNRASFCLRSEIPKDQFNVVIELGVHVYNLSAELEEIKKSLLPGGFFVYSSAGGKSLFRRIKLKGNKYANDYMPYSQVEKILQKDFIIRDAMAYGLFVPKLWKYPKLGRNTQSIIDFVFQYFAPEFFHEKVYVLELKSLSNEKLR